MSQPLPFLLTVKQGEAARALLSYVASLPLPGTEPQLLATVVTIRAVRVGTGNLTGGDLAALRLNDPPAAVEALRGLGWQIGDAIFDSDPAAPPVPVTVPDLACETDHPLLMGKQMRSRVSGWTTRALTAKPLKKLSPAARLAGLFTAAHSTATLLGRYPADLPEACRSALPHLLDKGFLAEAGDTTFQLAPAVGHLAGMRPPTDQERALRRPARPGSARWFEYDPEAWNRWKTAATPALRHHVESVESCSRCALSVERVAESFMLPPGINKFFSQNVKIAYGQWKDEHPDRGRQAAEYTVAFRAEHGHGPSFKQLGDGLGWTLPRPVLGFIVNRLLANKWLTKTGDVPWTLRPGTAAQQQGITLPAARKPQAPEPARS
ncbi:hypothetical protein [Streptomyces sp. NBC_01789]|uniref:hypothetical protein n=1 Tax=Streptomyces sp. NBC_01789 TaxID=2975941 RepID=UPI00225AF882|nr:hypothetical protein [Streptomyces sp. NBC_01789]MCX4444847.1 hypothetical protein [Streptomyces sp. NBC_01789]